MFAFGQLIYIVHEIDQQKFRGERLWTRWLHAKRKLTSAELELAVPFVIVHDGLVIKLRRTNA